MALSEFESVTDKVQITAKMIEEAKTPRGGWNAKQLAAVGISWPPKHGWRRQLVGRWVTQEQAEQFIDLGQNGNAPRNRENRKSPLKGAAMDFIVAARAKALKSSAAEIADDLDKAIAIMRAAGLK